MLETPRIRHYSPSPGRLGSDNVRGAGNQQERPVLTLEFLAGLIVGEGSYHLAIVVQRKKGYIEVRPQFSMRMNDLVTMERVIESFNHYGLDLYATPGLYQKCQQVVCYGQKRMRPHLDVLLPLLTGKKLQAASIIDEFLILRSDNHKGYDERDIALIERLREINGPSVRRIDTGILRDYARRLAG